MNLATQIVSTDEWMLTAPFTNPIEINANINAGLRPVESNSDPKTGEMIISVRAEHALRMDSVDVARSDPISAIRAGAGENATIANDRTIRKDDDWNTARSLRLHSGSGDDSSEGDVISFVFGFVCFIAPPPRSNNIGDCKWSSLIMGGFMSFFRRFDPPILLDRVHGSRA